ncbi:MAG: DMT family transporter [Actinomycetota bacterium]|nr:DMT family transporter [Actinomycetota bacterium]
MAAALCFGSTFPVTKEALEGTGPYAVVGLRFAAGGFLALPFALRRPRLTTAAVEGRAVAWCSLALLAGYLLLTVGLQSTSSTAAAFITYLLVVIVPVLSAVVLRTRLPAPVVLGVVLATSGLFLLAGDGFRLGVGEVLTLGCAFAFAVHILVLDHFAARVDVIRLSAFQLLVVGAGALVPALLRGELVDLDAGGLAACGFLALAGVGGLVLQVAGQRSVGPARTSLLLMLEPVLAAIGGYAIGERIAPLGFVGAALILAGILVSEVPAGRDRRRRLDQAAVQGG